MLEIIVKYSFIFFSCIQIYEHLLNTKSQIYSFSTLFKLLLSCSLGLLVVICKIISFPIPIATTFAILWIICTLHSGRPRLSFITLTLSLCITYLLFVTSTCLAVLVLAPLLLKLPTSVHISSALIPSLVFELVLIHLLFSIKRFKYGMPFLYAKAFNNLGLIASINTICIICLSPEQSSLQTEATLLFFCAVLSLIIIPWWQSQLKKQYIRRLRQLELESLRLEVQEKDERIAHLEERNEALGRLIHKDNHLIPALEFAVREFLSVSNTPEQQRKSEELLQEIQKLSTIREEIVTDINSAQTVNFQTGMASLDTLLNFLYKQAIGRHISFSFHMMPNISPKVLASIQEEDLVHMLSNLVDNAFIATTGCANRRVQVQMYESRKALIVEVADSGIPFEAASIINYGIVSMTTHADTGGSGIGLLDIWETKQKYRASLHITEYPADSPFTKKIVFSFDKKNKYMVYSSRAKELLKLLNRSDLQILEKEEVNIA